MRVKKYDVFTSFINDAFAGVGIRLIHLEPIEMSEISSISIRYNLDFDDAYQYAISERYDLTIVSFDGDFDRTQRGRKTPHELSFE